MGRAILSLAPRGKHGCVASRKELASRKSRKVSLTHRRFARFVILKQFTRETRDTTSNEVSRTLPTLSPRGAAG